MKKNNKTILIIIIVIACVIVFALASKPVRRLYVEANYSVTPEIRYQYKDHGYSLKYAEGLKDGYMQGFSIGYTEYANGCEQKTAETLYEISDITNPYNRSSKLSEGFQAGFCGGYYDGYTQAGDFLDGTPFEN